MPNRGAIMVEINFNSHTREGVTLKDIETATTAQFQLTHP